MTVLPLSLNGDTFNALKADFDTILRNTLSNMELKGADTAEMSIKLKISLVRDQTQDLDAAYEGAMRDIIKPKFDHAVQSVLQIKDKKDGTLAGNYELVWDPKEKKYEMREITNGQTSLFDKGGKTISVGPKALPEGDVIDADYREVGEEFNEGGQDEADGEKNDSGNTQKASVTPFDHLLQFIGKDLKIIREEYGFLTVCTEEGRIVLSSEIGEESPFYCEEEKLEPHIGHKVVCVGYGQSRIVNISIECEDCCAVLFSMDIPGGFEEGEDDILFFQNPYEDPDDLEDDDPDCDGWDEEDSDDTWEDKE